MTLSWVDERVTRSLSRIPQQISPNSQTQNHNWQYSTMTSSSLRHITAQCIWAAYVWAKWKQTQRCWCRAAQEEAAVVVLLTLSRSHRLSGQNKWYAFRKANPIFSLFYLHLIVPAAFLSLSPPASHVHTDSTHPPELISTFHSVGLSVQPYLWLD